MPSFIKQYNVDSSELEEQLSIPEVLIEEIEVFISYYYNDDEYAEVTTVELNRVYYNNKWYEAAAIWKNNIEDCPISLQVLEADCLEHWEQYDKEMKLDALL